MQQATLPSSHINFKKERDFSQKLNATFAFLSQNMRHIGKNLLLIAGPFALITGIFYGIYQSYAFGSGFSTTGPNPWNNFGNMPLMVSSILGMIFFSFIATALVVAIVMRHIRTYIDKGHTNLSTSYLWSTIWGDFFRVLGTTVYMFGFFIVCIFLLAIPAGIMSINGPNPVVIGLYIFFAGFGLLFFWPSLLLLFPIRFMEKKGVISATGRLFKLASGKWLSTVGLVIIVTIIQSIISIVFAIPMYIIMFMKAFHSQDPDSVAESSVSLNNILLTLTSGISMLGSFAMYSLLFVAITFQYFNLLERKEAKGLLERMEDFGKPKTDIDEHEEQY